MRDNMNDFEIHPIGTTKEIQLSRALTMAIHTNESRIRSYNVMPAEVMDAYAALRKHYDWQIQNEEGCNP